MTTQTEVDKDVAIATDEIKQTTEETKKEPSPLEVEARVSGWVTKEEWVAQGKNADEWRSAKEFQERGELFEEIHKLKDTNKKTAAAFKVLVEHHKKVRELAVKEALDKLKAEKKEALLNQDVERVLSLDEEIEKVRSAPVDVPKVDIPETEVGPSPVFIKWHKQNSWYDLQGKDEASTYANVLGAQYRETNPNAPESEVLKHVESKIARRFPELFENPNSKRTSDVNPKGDRVESHDLFKLSEAEEVVCKMLVRDGVMTRKAYIDEIKKVREA